LAATAGLAGMGFDAGGDATVSGGLVSAAIMIARTRSPSWVRPVLCYVWEFVVVRRTMSTFFRQARHEGTRACPWFRGSPRLAKAGAARLAVFDQVLATTGSRNGKPPFHHLSRGAAVILSEKLATTRHEEGIRQATQGEQVKDTRRAAEPSGSVRNTLSTRKREPHRLAGPPLPWPAQTGRSRRGKATTQESHLQKAGQPA
jgi:hypothetical protein